MIFRSGPGSESIKVSKKYWQIAKRLNTVHLQKNEEEKSFLDEADLFNINIGRRGHNLFLGYYSKAGLKLAFEKYGVFDALKKKGYRDIVFDVDTNDPYVHRITLFDRHMHHDNMLIEVVLKREPLTIQMPFKSRMNGKTFEALEIEWMCMQNPADQFSAKRPRLPKQHYPGLGMASMAVELLLITAWRLNLAGLVNTPEHFHNAFLYSRIFFYFDPGDQACLLAMVRDLEKYSLHEIAWAMEYDAIIDETTGQPFKWFVAKQIVPLDRELKKLFNSRDYRQLVKTKMNDFKFRFDQNKFNQINKRRLNEIKSYSIT